MNYKLLIFDVDETLTKPKQIISNIVFQNLINLSKYYIIAILGARDNKVLYTQLNKIYSCHIFGSYGLNYIKTNKDSYEEIYNIEVKQNKDEVQFLTNKTRNLYGFKEYSGQSLELHSSGMITFPLLGTKAKIKEKLQFDPNSIIRRELYENIKDLFSNYSLIIGGTSSFDILPKGIDKAYGLYQIKNYLPFLDKEILYIGNDFNKYGNDYALLGLVDCYDISKNKYYYKNDF